MKTVHLSLDVRGCLMNWKMSQLKGLLVHDNGKRMTALEVKGVLLDELAKGHEKLPIGDCEGFDFKKGCPGHPSDTPTVLGAIDDRLQNAAG